jgi:RNA polymerase sigma factor (sigma-70 family)
MHAGVTAGHGYREKRPRRVAPMTDVASVRAQRDDLYRFIVRRTRDPAAAEDLVQETFARLLTYERARTVVDRAALGYSIALNLVRDHFRSRKRRPVEALNDDIPCEAPAPEQILMHRQKVEVFGKALDAMPPLRRDVFIRRRLHGQTCRQIAADLAMNEAAVEKHVVRALEQLHREVARAERRQAGRRA